MNKYRVWMRSVPGMFEQYNGSLEVLASKQSLAFDAACDKLRKTSFPDRNRGMWQLEKVELIEGVEPEGNEDADSGT